MSKVSVLTIFGSNYGAILQAFALQKYIKMNYPEMDTFLCNTAGKTRVEILNKRYSPNAIKNCIIKLIVLLRYRSLKRAYNRKEQFKKEEFTECDVSQIGGSVLYLTGSDQVFNPSMPHKEVFFQQFKKEDGIKAAYAPSFGISVFPPDFVAEVKPLLEDFDYLSCREEAGATFMASLLKKKVEHVCDPTLLLDESIWHSVARPNKYGKYIFIYDLNGGQELVKIALKIKKETKLKIVCQTQRPQRLYTGVDYQIYDSGPREFVGLFESTDYVVTDSFHGLMFSLIFDKPFFLYIASKATSSRINEVVEMLNIQDSVLESSAAYCHMPNGISEDSRKKLNGFIDNSKTYINTILHDVYAEI